MSTPRDSLDIAASALATAQKYGASDAVVSLDTDRNVELTYRAGRVERLKDATTRALRLAAYVDGRSTASWPRAICGPKRSTRS